MSQKIPVEGVGVVEFPDDATQQEISEALNRDFPKPLPETSAAGAFGRHVAKGVVPTIAGGYGFLKGAAVGELLAPELTPFSGLIGGALGAFGLGAGASYAQEKALEAVSPKVSEFEQADIQQHPKASAAGSLTSGLVGFELNPGATIQGLRAIPSVVKGTATAAQSRAVQAAAANLALQGGLTTGTSLLQGRLPTGGELAESAAFALLYGHPRSYLRGKPVTPGVTDAVRERSAEKVPVEKPSGDSPPVEPRAPGAEEPAVPQGQAQPAPLPPETKPKVTRILKGDDGYYITNEDRSETLAGPFETLDLAREADRQLKTTPASKAAAPEKPAAQPPPTDPYEAAEREAIENAEASQHKGTDFVEEPPAPTSDDPFAKGGDVERMAWVDKQDGRLKINRPVFRAWIRQMANRGLPWERIRENIAILAMHERIHTATDPNDAAAYWNNLTAAEQRLLRRAYTGEWSGEINIDGKPYKLTDSQLGAEAIRRQLQRIVGMSRDEFAQMVGKEHWKQKMFDLLERIIYNIRRALGTKASEMQKAFLDKVADNLRHGRHVVQPELTELPLALFGRKKKEREQFIAGLAKKYPLPVMEQEGWNQGLDARPIQEISKFYGKDWLTGLADYLKAVDALKSEKESRPDEFGPMAFRKKDKYDPEQSEIFGGIGTPWVGARGVAGQEGGPEVVGSGVSYSPITPDAVSALADKSFAPGGTPSFKEFLAEAKKTFGPKVQAAQVKDLWQDAVWKNLMSAPGKQLKDMVKSMNLAQRVVGTIRLKGSPSAEERFERLEIPDSSEAKPITGQLEFGGVVEDSVSRRQQEAEGEDAASLQRRRNRVISTIAQKLIGQAQEIKQKPLNRSEVGFDDIAWNEASPSTAWRRISQRYLTSPEKEQEQLGEGARTSGRKVSETKRVTAMIDKDTFDVHLVSTYVDGRRGLVINDPLGVRGVTAQHVPLAERSKRFQPIYSMLLDEPVENFHRSFRGKEGKTGIEQFNEQIANQANEHVAREERRTGSYLRSAGLAPEESPIMKGRITDAEVGSIYDRLTELYPRLEGPQSVRDHISELAFQNEIGRPNWGLISAYNKIFRAVRRANPELTPEQALDKLYEEIYSKAREAGERQNFIEAVLQSHGGQHPEDVRPSGRIVPPAEPGRSGSISHPTETVAPGTLPPTEFKPTEGQLAVEKGVSPPPTFGTEIPTREGPLPGAPKRPMAGRSAFSGAPKSPMAIRLKEVKDSANDEWNRTSLKLQSIFNRREAKQDIPRLRDAAQGLAAMYAMGAEKSILLENEDPKYLAAARTVISSGEIHKEWEKGSDGKWYKNPKAGQYYQNRRNLDVYDALLDHGRRRAEKMLRNPDPRDKRVGRQWLNAVEKLQSEVDFARAHWDDPKLKQLVEATRAEMSDAIRWENDHGMDVTERTNYVPNIFEGEFWDDSGVMFSQLKVLGKNFRQKRRFDTVYHAISEGPYIPKSNSVAELAKNRIYSGRSMVNKRLFVESIKDLDDPSTKSKIAVGAEPIIKPQVLTDEDTGAQHIVNVTKGYKSPSPARTLVETGRHSPPIAVLRGYERVLNDVLGESEFPDWFGGGGASALWAASALKHGALLTFDVFHPARLLQYGTALGGKDWKTVNFGWNGGYAALNYRPHDLVRAVKAGKISQDAANWAQAKIKVRKDGTIKEMTRQQLAHDLVAEGLNAARITDALYKDAVDSIPIIGEHWGKVIKPFNRAVFDHLTTGLMVETAVRNFERMAADNPKIPYLKLAKDVVRDTNIFYGNMGRQGVFRNPTIRDMAQVVLLAPAWLEGLVQKDVRFLSRAGGAAARGVAGMMGKELPYRQGLPAMGTLGRGVARGLFAYFIATQVINLIVNKRLTIDNEDPAHKFDAYIPPGSHGNVGFYLSPMAVFNEVVHDVFRLLHTKPNTYEALAQIGENKLGPIGRAAYVLGTRESPTHEKLTTTGSILKTSAEQLAPVPISFGKVGQYLLNKAAPNLVSPPKAGEMVRQAAATFAGQKWEIAPTDQQRLQKMASKYVKDNNLKAEPYAEVPTDEASYTKLRAAIRNGDDRGAKSLLQDLRKTHNDGQIVRAMQMWAKRPFTGSKQHESQFVSSLDDKDLDLYFRANMSRSEDLQTIMDWLINHL